MEELKRELAVFADGAEIGRGCRVELRARSGLGLHPRVCEVAVDDLSESSGALLRGAREIEIRSGDSLLAWGRVMTALTRPLGARRRTEVTFAAGLDLWEASAALTLAGPMRVSDAMRALLRASGTGMSLAAFTAEDRTLARPQAFFGRVCEGLESLAGAVEADLALSPAGVCVLSRGKAGDRADIMEEAELLAAPLPAGDHLLIRTRPRGWQPGCQVRGKWKGQSYAGRALAVRIQADNREGPWLCEVEVEM